MVDEGEAPKADGAEVADQRQGDVVDAEDG